ncbi:hypothetical protein M427DRAFT_43983 [Gonapodya prolifera JEL478]|uniref:Uncharacterized protein n=1 Tax=Gonapodya prolifera (strain JEL478) TaxID=1344416 RepID=A0A139AHM5_GONPJ|nr:hypothetical protein M427DRAFT_43983 [Gonapodya prolifera JEL478]|eukprot:KXS16189.1 hypothetical protein M427DRAFT_43983 [Gonapodya prolifera JEL478]
MPSIWELGRYTLLVVFLGGALSDVEFGIPEPLYRLYAYWNLQRAWKANVLSSPTTINIINPDTTTPEKNHGRERDTSATQMDLQSLRRRFSDGLGGRPLNSLRNQEPPSWRDSYPTTPQSLIDDSKNFDLPSINTRRIRTSSSSPLVSPSPQRISDSPTFATSRLPRDILTNSPRLSPRILPNSNSPRLSPRILPSITSPKLSPHLRPSTPSALAPDGLDIAHHEPQLFYLGRPASSGFAPLGNPDAMVDAWDEDIQRVRDVLEAGRAVGVRNREGSIAGAGSSSGFDGSGTLDAKRFASAVPMTPSTMMGMPLSATPVAV